MVLALVFGLVVALPASAADTPTPQPNRPLTAATAAKLAKLDAMQAAAFLQAAPAATSGESKPFLKSPKGVIAITVLAGGIAWVVVSRNKDAVQSPARQ